MPRVSRKKACHRCGFRFLCTAFENIVMAFNGPLYKALQNAPGTISVPTHVTEDIFIEVANLCKHFKESK
jgi:hypothetical protein